METTESELAEAQRTFEERQCRVGSPRGPFGIVEKVFLGRGRQRGQIRAKVILDDTAAVRYVPLIEVYRF